VFANPHSSGRVRRVAVVGRSIIQEVGFQHKFLKVAGKEAAQRGHCRVGSEHLLLALIASHSGAGEALRAAGVSYESFSEEIARVPRSYHEVESLALGVQIVRPDAMEVVARAEGLALAYGARTVEAEHVLVSLLWARDSILALTLLTRMKITRARILRELKSLKVDVPAVPLPEPRRWGPWNPISRARLDPMTKALRGSGFLYRYKERDGEILISVEEPQPGH
jgi:hypothetical protein